VTTSCGKLPQQQNGINEWVEKQRTFRHHG
jgi:hypothetical protein